MNNKIKRSSENRPAVFLPKIILVALAVYIGFCGLTDNQAMAATDEELASFKAQLESTLANDPDVINCRERLVPIYDLETVEFLRFLEDNFQNKSSNSTLTNAAIARYRGYKKDLEFHFSKIEPLYSTDTDLKTYTQAFEAYSLCSTVTEAYLQIAREKMIAHIQATSNQKRTTAFIEKYQAINDRLRDTNLEVAQMYGYFLTFKNKLPGFTPQCIQQ